MVKYIASSIMNLSSWCGVLKGMLFGVVIVVLVSHRNVLIVSSQGY